MPTIANCRAGTGQAPLLIHPDWYSRFPFDFLSFQSGHSEWWKKQHSPYVWFDIRRRRYISLGILSPYAIPNGRRPASGRWYIAAPPAFTSLPRFSRHLKARQSGRAGTTTPAAWESIFRIWLSSPWFRLGRGASALSSRATARRQYRLYVAYWLRFSLDRLGTWSMSIR